MAILETMVTDKLKWELAKGVVRATEAAGLMDQPRFLEAIGMPADWLRRAIDDRGAVPMDEYVRVYDAAAQQAGWKSLDLIIRSAMEYQRFNEWPE